MTGVLVIGGFVIIFLGFASFMLNMVFGRGDFDSTFKRAGVIMVVILLGMFLVGIGLATGGWAILQAIFQSNGWQMPVFR